MTFDFSKIVGFEWDKGNLEHIKKHKVEYKECEQIFFNKPLLISKDETHSHVEKMLQAMGLNNKGRLLFISFTIRTNKIRIISARDQDKKERRKMRVLGGDKV